MDTIEFDFTVFTTARLTDAIDNLRTAPAHGDPETDEFFAAALAAAEVELARRNVRTYRVIIDREDNTGDYINDYLFTGTKAEFIAAHNLTGRHNPHRATGTVQLTYGHVMHWGVQD